ncbi:phage tail tape measure protein [Arsenophonus endosymbiont of Aleurodicus floccissimus]|uniref:phage tail tape measure protein n=1 Tax=Arsenophonus endosymbiont of Aleurodicus floccissimus TaxID=2152761 RepID=UPI003F6F11A4
MTAIAGPIKQAIDFESTMADVRKVVDFDPPEQFKQMSEDIFKLSTELPMADDGIGQIVAAGGQAGIVKKELMSFAKSAVKMGIAFDQTAEQSGQMMAQ